jgi:exocyst complex protein 7
MRKYQSTPNTMAVGLGSRVEDEEARAEVEVLNSRLEKTSQLTKRIQASLNRLEASGQSLGDAIKPLSSKTQTLQVQGRSMPLPIRVYTLC